jgi:internalin A
MADSQEILELIEAAFKDGWTQLDLGNSRLTSLPLEILKLTNLRALNLSQNQLTSLPPEIAKLTNLTTLNLSNNQLIRLPAEIGGLSNLTRLYLNNNQLIRLPTEFGGLSNLTKLFLSNNQLTSFPLETARLTNLTLLDLSNNRLMSVPPEIARLTKLTRLNVRNTQLIMFPAEVVRLNNLTTLDLGYNKLKRLSPRIANLTNLTLLYLGGNQLKRLQPEITKLIKLRTLNLDANQLTRLPPEFTKLTNLRDLRVRGNRLTSLPSEIGNLSNLTSLRLDFNQITSLPPEIGSLINLSTLRLYSNQLMSLPPEITKLTNLKFLRLGRNQFTRFPSEIAKLTNLTGLRLSGNQLTNLPEEVSKLTCLVSFRLGRNQLKSLPPEIGSLTNLTSLSLHNNRLMSLPAEIGRLTNLTNLDLSNNLLSSLPPEITKLTSLTRLGLKNIKLPIPPETLANPEDVKTVFAAIAGLVNGQRLNEAKMLVVGDPEVGKSSVVERLIYNTYNPHKQTTLGVEINDEMKVVESEVLGDGEPLKLNIWDFGGQEIQHSTHQFFLTTRSLYLMVVDARKGDQIRNLEYWLKLIESFAGDSPIVIVINKIDQLKGQRPLNLDRKALQQKYNIRAFIETSCATGEGIRELKVAIAREVEHLKHVRDIWPREWLAIKQRLQIMQADYIPVEKYLEICAEEQLHDEDIRFSLLGLLHDLGVVIRFPGDTEVLNPRWVTQGVYGLLTSEQLVEDQGQFDLKDVGSILAGLPDAKDRYPAHTHRRLIDVMQHFELCFEFTDRPSHYLIPRHLHDNEPDIHWDDAGALKFQYHYETLPDSVISRFIVRMNQFISEQHHWKNGVFLEDGKGDKNLAKIKADLVDRKIFVAVIGKEQTRRAFLAVIRSAFDEINSNFKIEIKQMIPVPGCDEVLVSYEDLLAYEESNEQEIFIPELRKRFAVRELLDGVEELGIRMKRRDRHSHGRRFPQPLDEEVQAKQRVRIFRVVVASPTDVQPERDVLPSVIEEVTHAVAADRGLRLELSRWETDAYPGFHLDGPQGFIDPILKITDCDLLIGIFWKRFGTPSEDGQSGTEHEFNSAHEAWKEKGSPQIFVYFNEKAYTPKSKAETEQWGQVLEFKEKFPKEGLWWPYKGKAQFEKLVRNHLTNYIRTLT